MLQTDASSTQTTSSQTFSDLNSMTLAVTAGGVWGALFSCVLTCDQPTTVEFEIDANGSPVKTRQLRIEPLGAKNPRTTLLSAVTGVLSNGHIVKVRWRTLYGSAKIADRSLMAWQ